MASASASLDYVVLLFSLTLGLAVARTLPQLVSFYAWFKDSGLEMAQHRGYGQLACKLYGSTLQHAPNIRLV